MYPIEKICIIAMCIGIYLNNDWFFWCGVGGFIGNIVADSYVIFRD